jgi:hypothetical protein
MRELTEETGIEVVDMDFVAVAECDLQRPNRRECTALYRTDLQMTPQLVISDEALAFLWRNPQLSIAAHIKALDAEMARLTI